MKLKCVQCGTVVRVEVIDRLDYTVDENHKLEVDYSSGCENVWLFCPTCQLEFGHPDSETVRQQIRDDKLATCEDEPGN